MNLICIGDNMADLYPEQGYLYPGGSTYNVAVQARRSDLKCAYLGTMGNDFAGRYLYQILQDEGIDLSRVRIKEGKNASSRVFLEQGERKITEVDKGIDRELILSEEDFSYISDYRVLHTTAYSYIEKYLQELNQAGLIISLDYSFKNSEEYLKKTAAYVDIAFFSGAALDKDYQEFMKHVAELGPEHIFVTLGEKGAVLYYRGKFYHQPGYRVKPIDTLGAGDAFAAAVIKSYFFSRDNTARDCFSRDNINRNCFNSDKINRACDSNTSKYDSNQADNLNFNKEKFSEEYIERTLALAVKAGARACSHYGGIGRGIPLREKEELDEAD